VTESVTIILPALDEAEVIGRVVAGLLDCADEVIVVDNNSSDGTGDRAADAGARVVVEPRRGFGSACWAGTMAARGDILCFLDADGSFAPADVPRVVEPVLRRSLDLSLGSRTLGPRGAMRRDHRVINRVVGSALPLVGAPRTTDIGPLRAIRRQTLLELGVRDRGFGWPLEMIVRCGKAGLRIGEVPVAYLPRLGGRSKVSGSLRGSIRAAQTWSLLLAREAMR
jgi:glycosyltransferase involved in cell wall biosynthesis